MVRVKRSAAAAASLHARVFRFSQIAEISSFRRKPESSVSCCKEVLGSRFRGNDGVSFLKLKDPALHANPFHTRGATRRRLTNRLFCMAHEGRMPFGVVKTFRRIYDLPARLAAASDYAGARRPVRRARNRVAAMVRAVERAVAGCPQLSVVRRRETFRFAAPPRPTPASMSEILALPDYAQIAAAHGLTGVPLRKRPDPHGLYQRGLSPKPCSCHPEPLDLSQERGNVPVPLSPLWQKALSQTFKRNFPDQLPY